MGFLHKIWDETLAGPTPDTGLGKLRKYNSFSATRSTAASPLDVAATTHDDDHLIPVSRSITVVRSDAHRNLNVSFDSPPVPSSPAGTSAPSSPFSPLLVGISRNSRGENRHLGRCRTRSQRVRLLMIGWFSTDCDAKFYGSLSIFQEDVTIL
ncbi:hypothetical protein Pfo_012322 [Paulownia fortunei]|nr:hypothetical protein Pfo_012322 [Paulownia fortunei]